MATPASVPPVPTALTKPSTLPSVCSQISGPVVRTWTSRLATLSNWLAKIAPCGCSRASRSAIRAGDLHVIVVAPVGRRRDLDERRAERAERVLLLLALRLRDDDHRLHAERIADDGQADAGVPRRPLDDDPAGPKLALVDRVGDDSERRAVLHRMAGVHELGLAEDGAAGFLRRAAELDQRRVADRGEDGVADVHAPRLTDSAVAAVAQIIRPPALAPRLGAVAGLDPAARRFEEVLRRLRQPFELARRGAA